MSGFKHIAVLLEEIVNSLNVQETGTYVDCTMGGGGHSALILSQLNQEGRLIAFDQDQDAIRIAQQRFRKEIEQGKLILVQSNFRNLKKELIALGIDKVDGVIYDLGVSSPQLDQVQRGFSYQKDSPLDMRMDQNQALTAYEVVNEWSYNQLVSIFFKYGEEKFSKQIARKIEAQRKISPISTTYQLVELIKEGIPAPARRTGGHPAKRVFQAIRIAVNDELKALEESLDQALALITIGARVSAISFHSLEDRIVKQTFKSYDKGPDVPRGLPVIPEEFKPKFKLLSKKPILPSESELEENNRSRSARLRVIERIHED